VKKQATSNSLPSPPKWEAAGCPPNLNALILLLLCWRVKKVMAHHVDWMNGLPLKDNEAVHMLMAEPTARHHPVHLTVQYIPCSLLSGDSSW